VCLNGAAAGAGAWVSVAVGALGAADAPEQLGLLLRFAPGVGAAAADAFARDVAELLTGERARCLATLAVA